MQDISLTKHFKLSEFVASRTAEKHGIDNTPPQEAVANLRRLCEGCLEPLREQMGLPVVVTSGFRTKRLNDLLAHSSDRSQHMQGCAADFHVAQGPVSGSKFQVSDLSRRELLMAAFKLILTSPEIDFDQLILYPSFIHVSFVSKERNRRNILKARSDGKLGYGRLSLSSAMQIA